MKIVVQRVLQASVIVDGNVVGAIDRGVLVLMGVTHGDSFTEVSWLANKLVHLRLFQDEQGKTNRSLIDVAGQALIVSQFTLYADCSVGRRPSFGAAADPLLAKDLYEKFIAEVENKEIKTQSGIFGADMKVSLINDGPVTLLLEKTAINSFKDGVGL